MTRGPGAAPGGAASPSAPSSCRSSSATGGACGPRASRTSLWASTCSRWGSGLWATGSREAWRAREPWGHPRRSRGAERLRAGAGAGGWALANA